MDFLRNVISRAIVACALLLYSIHAIAEPQNGWWWNPNESGRGFFIEMTGGVMYLAGYFYERDGRATWLSSGGAVTDLYSYSGTLQSYRGGQSMFGAYRAPDPAVDVGPVTVTFTDDSHGTITWPGGTVPIERQIFDTHTATFQPKTGWWWNAAESGSGYSVEVQGDNAFVVAFMYDDSGSPVWYFTAGPLTTPNHFEGDWLEFAGGQTLTGPYSPPATPRNLGRVTIDFAAADDATITFVEGAASKRLSKASKKSSKISGRSRSSRTGPQFPAPTWNIGQFWPRFLCTATQQFVIVEDAISTFNYTKRYQYHLTFNLLSGSTGRYILDPSSSVDYAYSSRDSHNGCEQSGSRNGITTLAGRLDISPYLYYTGRVSDFVGSSVTVSERCPPPGDAGPDRVDRVPIDIPLGNGQSVVQRPVPFASSLPPGAIQSLPYMDVTDSRRLDDGSLYTWGWNCTAGL